MKLKLRKGFTLIELMIVVGILIILASIAVPSYTRYTAGARRAKCISNMRAIQEAKFAWAASNPGLSTLTDVTGLVSGGYFRGPTDGQGPKCPCSGNYTYDSARTLIGRKPTCSYGTGDGSDFAHEL